MGNPADESGVAAFRFKLLAAMACVVLAITLAGLYLAERSVAAETQHDLQLAFSSEVGLLRTVREIRHASLAERCRALVRKPRIHAALEDDALDLLYPSAKEELGDALAAGRKEPDDPMRTVRARFYRFLGLNGAVIAPFNAPEVGVLDADEEQRLSFPSVLDSQQSGYVVRRDGEIVEVIATPIISMETGEPIAALVAGFSPAAGERQVAGLKGGLWLGGKLHLAGFSAGAVEELSQAVSQIVSRTDDSATKGVRMELDGAEHMLFVEHLNPGSLFPPAYEVGVFPLAHLLARQSELRWQALLAGAVLLGLGIAASYAISTKLAAPVRALAAVSAENRVLKERAEAALEVKRAELERTARFSADASHQLKTPVAVFRAGLDELLARDDVPADAREELFVLVHQTFRLTSIIESLLLLSRLDSGRLKLSLVPLDLNHLVETCVDDFLLLHDEAEPDVQTDLQTGLHISGDVRYTRLILQNLLENARKYGHAGSPIRLLARAEGQEIVLTVANRGIPIPRTSWEHIFERFHRAGVGENIPGHGLGLNLSRELCALHGGGMRVIRSDADWTEFEVRFRQSGAPLSSMAGV